MKCLFPVLLFLGLLVQTGRADEYTFSAAEAERKPYHFGGYLEFRPVLIGFDKNASLYKANLFDKNPPNPMMEYDGRFWFDASFQKGIAGFYLQTSTDYTQSDIVTATNRTKAYQAYLSLKPSSSLTIDAGKKTSKWGKGYAWNPAAFVDRPKDPNDPELALEGYEIASADYIKSFSGPLKTFSFTPVILPAYGDVNSNDFGRMDHLNFAAKAYFLLYDTDMDVMFLTGGSKTSRYGFDFSRNIGTSLEVHGEFALINHFKKVLVDASGNVSQRTYDAVNYVLGLRYLSALNTTCILEYYHQGTGYSPRQAYDFFSFVDTGYNAFLATGDTRGLARAASATQGTQSNYGMLTPETDYLYLRVSQQEPFDILYFTPALTWIYNLRDRSFSITPELLYSPITNLELRLRTGFLVAGQKNSEFGEKQSDYRAELRARYYF
jgi:hypothetical protein